MLTLLRVLLWWSSITEEYQCLTEHTFNLSGTVTELVESNGVHHQHRATFVLRTEEQSNATCISLVGKKVRLTWYRAPSNLMNNLPVQLEVKLRPPWGSYNPGGFDYRLWLLSKNIWAVGYVKGHLSTQKSLDDGHGKLQYAQDTLARQSKIDLSGHLHAPLLAALAIGDQRQITQEHWALFRDTGTIHLMVISGLHVGIFSSAVFFLIQWLVRWILRGLPHPPSWTDPIAIGAFAGCLAALSFAYLSGLQAPAVRAALMCCVAAIFLAQHRHTGQWLSVLFIVALLNLLVSPNLILAHGFWLSYLAVSILVTSFRGYQDQPNAVGALLKCQFALFICLTPWLGVIVGPVPMISPLANLLVVPPMTLVIIPAAMFGFLISSVGMLIPENFSSALAFIGHGLLSVADFGLYIVLQILDTLSHYRQQIGYFEISQFVFALLASIVLVLPFGKSVKAFALLGWLVQIPQHTSNIAMGEFRVLVLDVGQGSSAIIDTRHTRTVIDGGVAFSDGFNSGSAIVIPAIYKTGSKRLHNIVVSHLDSDHVGGISAVQKQFPGAQTFGLDEYCPKSWVADGVHFRFLQVLEAKTKNDRSCTLLISNPRSSAFIAADISKKSELVLLAKLPQNIDLLVAPHHGSASSSSQQFVNHLMPRVVIFSAARFNRYDHPRLEVLRKYADIGARLATTGNSGAVTWSSTSPHTYSLARDSFFRR